MSGQYSQNQHSGESFEPHRSPSALHSLYISDILVRLPGNPLGSAETVPEQIQTTQVSISEEAAENNTQALLQPPNLDQGKALFHFLLCSEFAAHFEHEY